MLPLPLTVGDVGRTASIGQILAQVTVLARAVTVCTDRLPPAWNGERRADDFCSLGEPAIVGLLTIAGVGSGALKRTLCALRGRIVGFRLGLRLAFQGRIATGSET